MTIKRRGGPDSIKVIRQGVLIEVGIESDPSEAVHTVLLEIISKRDEVLRISLGCRVQSPWTTKDISLEPGSRAQWTVEGPHRISVEMIVQPDEGVTTGYSIPASEEVSPEGLLQAPQIDSITTVDQATKVTAPASETEHRATGTGGSKSLEPVSTRLNSIKSLFTKSGRADDTEAERHREAETGEREEEEEEEAIQDLCMVSGDVSVTRTIHTTPEQVAVTNRIGLDGSTPQRLLLVDPYPSEWSVDRVEGPIESYEPTVLERRPHVVIEGFVTQDRPLEVTYWLSMQVPPSAALERIQTARPPWIEFGVRMQPDEDAEAPSPDEGPTVLVIPSRSVSKQGRSEDPKPRSRSQELRVKHLEARIAEITAYSAELKRFIDRHTPLDSEQTGGFSAGLTPRDPLTSDRLDAPPVENLKREVDDLRRIVESHEARIAANEQRCQAVGKRSGRTPSGGRRSGQEK